MESVNFDVSWYPNRLLVFTRFADSPFAGVITILISLIRSDIQRSFGPYIKILRLGFHAQLTSHQL